MSHPSNSARENRPRPPLSPRRRRLRVTVAILLFAAAAGILAGVIARQRTKPAIYRPDEQNTEITRSLLRTLPPDAPAPRFADVTAAAGLSSFLTFSGPRSSQLPEDMGSGAAWGDFDRDGDDDLFLVSAGGALGVSESSLAASQLFENLGNGSFKRVDAFPDLRLHGMGAAWGDYDSDGYLDLAVTGYDILLLLHNEGGSGRFSQDPRFGARPGFWAGVSWGDYDNDLRLDLYVCGYVRYAFSPSDQARVSSQLGTAVPYSLNPSSFEPAANLLFHNRGAGTFEEVAQNLGVDNPTGRSLGALWHDFDQNGWLDLYVANDIAGSVLYHNTGGAFEDMSAAAWVTDYRSAMGLAAGDYNRDGDDDLFITHWVAQENALFDNRWADLPGSLRPPSPGTLASTNAQAPHLLRFMDLNEARGLGQISLPMVGWGTEFVDLDGDGWLDLVAVNGSTLECEGPPPHQLQAQVPFLLWNCRGEAFHDLAPLHPQFSQPHVSRGMAVADYDHDGDMDLVLIHLDQGVQLLRNDMQTGHWLELRLRSRDARGNFRGFGDGACAIAHLPEASLRRTVSSASYLSQSSRLLHFGLGQADVVPRLEVRWLGGAVSWYSNLQANVMWEITEGDPTPQRLQTPAMISAKPVSGGSSSSPTRPSPPPTDVASKTRLIEFWRVQRAAMNAMKVEQDIPKATELFRQALRLNPSHEDSRYYLGNCLAMQHDMTGALAELAELVRIDPHSHRGHAQWGTLRAISAHSEAELVAAEGSLETAHRINPEETGALLVLGEVALLRGDAATADARLAQACRTNPKAIGGYYLRAYLANKSGQAAQSHDLLQKAREALGKDWQPKGTTAEGDVQRRWHIERTPLSRFWESWDGTFDRTKAFAALDEHLQRRAHDMNR